MPIRAEYIPYRRNVPGAQAEPADVLTGELLDDHMPRLLVRDYDESRPPGDRYPIPSSINVARIDVGDGKRDASPDREGGKAWSPDFKRYIGAVLPREVAEEKRRWLSWWEIEYVRGRMFARFGKDVVEAVLRVERDGESLDEVARSVKQSRLDLCRNIGRVRKLSASYFSYGVHQRRIRMTGRVRDEIIQVAHYS